MLRGIFRGQTLPTVVDQVLQAVEEGDIRPDVAADWIERRLRLPRDKRIYCVPCIERRLIRESKERGGEEMGKVIKVDDAFYERVKAMAAQEGRTIGEVVEGITPGVGQRVAFEELRKECAEELGIPVAVDPAWEERMLQVIPPGFSPKLDRIREVWACALDKLLPEKEAAKAEEVTEAEGD